MSSFGNIVIIRRNGQEGSVFPIKADVCVLGKQQGCDIRVQLPKVALEHAKLIVDSEKKTMWIKSISGDFPTYVNEKAVTAPMELSHKDFIRIADRSFRFEYPEGAVRSSTTPPLKEVQPTQRLPTPASPASARKNRKRSSTKAGMRSSMNEEKNGGESASRRRSVRFGPILTPEYFDKSMPPKMPVCAGRTPDGRRRLSPGMMRDPRRSQIRTPPRKRSSLCGGDLFKTDVEEELPSTPPVKAPEDMETDDVSPLVLEFVEEEEGEVEDERKMATPVKKQIEGGVELKETMKKMATPLRKGIQNGVELKETMKKMATPMRKEIEDGLELKETMKKMATPLRKGIQEGMELKQTKKRMATPMRKEIQDGVDLKETMKKMATPLRKGIQEGVELKETMKKMATPLRQEIEDGLELKEVMKKMGTPLRQEIQLGVDLKETMKKMGTPLRKEIQDGIELKETTKTMATPMRKEIEGGLELRKTKRKMATPLRREIKKGVELKLRMKKMATPLRREIRGGLELKKRMKKMATPLRKGIQNGTKLKETKKMMATPLRKEIQGGTELKKTKRKMATPMRNQITAGISLRKSKRMSKRLATPMRKAIAEGVDLKPVLRKGLATPVREEIRRGKALKRTKRKLQTPLRNAITRGTKLKTAMAQKKAAAIEKVKMVEKISVMETVDGSEMLRSTATRKKAAIAERKTLKAVRRLKAPPLSTGPAVFHFQGVSPSPACASPAAKKARVAEKRLTVEEADMGDVYEARLFKTPKKRNGVAEAAKNFEPNLFTTPVVTSAASEAPKFDGMKTPEQKRGAGSSAANGVKRLVTTPKKKNDSVPEENFVSSLFASPSGETPAPAPAPPKAEVVAPLRRSTRNRKAPSGVAEQRSNTPAGPRKKNVAEDETVTSVSATTKRAENPKRRTRGKQVAEDAVILVSVSKSSTSSCPEKAVDCVRRSGRLAKKVATGIATVSADVGKDSILKTPGRMYVTPPARPRRKRTQTIRFHEVVEQKIIPKRKKKF